MQSLDLDIPPQSHLAIVGPSGAGKSSLVGLLLGWHRTASGEILVDGQPLSGTSLTSLRQHTAWIDPSVQLRNRSLLDNLLYGNSNSDLNSIGEVIQQADLYDVLQRLPDGLQSFLGESGGLLSGGEGQRVKLGRGFARKEPRLVILDEIFRGLKRAGRQEMLRRARLLWKDATLIFISHDISETLDFPRVWVLDGGRLIEDGPPQQLLSHTESLFGTLLEAEREVRDGLWGTDTWRRIRLQDGRIVEGSPQNEVAP